MRNNEEGSGFWARTDAEFDQLSWHDCHIWGLDFVAGDRDAGDWTSDLVLHLDYIVEWLCAADGSAAFRVAAATLAFHGVSDPRIVIDWGDSGFRTALHGIAIDRIERARVANQQVFLDRPYYRWRILLNWPAGGEIAFGAAGFTQTLLGEPLTSGVQHLTRTQRQAFGAR